MVRLFFVLARCKQQLVHFFGGFRRPTANRCDKAQPSEVRLSYEEMFIDFSNICEKWLKRSIGFLFALLLVVQLLLQFATVRNVLQRVDGLEGEPYRLHKDRLAEK